MMEKKKCFQFIVKDKVQDVGLRLAIAKLIPDELDVRADNLPDGSVRVIVRGYKRDVMGFWKELRKHVLGKAENPTFPGPAGITTMPIQTDRFFHKLQCEQMEKFVDVGLDMKNSIDRMSSKIGGMDSRLDGMNSKLDGVSSKLDGVDSKLGGINSKLDGVNSKLDGMNSTLHGMNSTLSSMDSKLDTLPENMAKEIAKLKKNGLL